MSSRVLIPLALADFDPSEVAQPWRHCRSAGYEVVFATEDGTPGACDPRLLTGVIFGQLGASPENIRLYREIQKDPAFTKPIRFADVRPGDFAGISLPGGHAKGMRPYLESKALQAAVLGFFKAGLPVASICHGGIVLARTIDPATGKSVIHGRTMTALTKLFERMAYFATAWKLGGYYRTYPEYVQDEMIRAIGDPSKFKVGPLIASYSFPFTVRDGDLLTARWPGDAESYGTALVAMLDERKAAAPAAQNNFGR